ncbi:hypothetical protein L6452_04046 [Arctium lappa]|uniref:Uncharacterized protein n=1 Tax=Arctium lappa TaxID=4217 RepID=A0ACB9FP27_ARCLA|nr:hypothetical protein L6452_04046 [Arctium lappa]
MKDLTMEDRERHTAEVKGKEAAETKQKDKPLRAYNRKKKRNTDDKDFKSVPIINIGSSSRSTRSTTHAHLQKTNEMNESTAEKVGTDLKDKGSASNTTIKTEAALYGSHYQLQGRSRSKKTSHYNVEYGTPEKKRNDRT